MLLNMLHALLCIDPVTGQCILSLAHQFHTTDPPILYHKADLHATCERCGTSFARPLLHGMLHAAGICPPVSLVHILP